MLLSGCNNGQERSLLWYLRTTNTSSSLGFPDVFPQHMTVRCSLDDLGLTAYFFLSNKLFLLLSLSSIIQTYGTVYLTWFRSFLPAHISGILCGTYWPQHHWHCNFMNIVFLIEPGQPTSKGIELTSQSKSFMKNLGFLCTHGTKL
jgi:hypothetical protein